MSSVNDQPSIVSPQENTTEKPLSEEERRKTLIRLLQSWREGNEQEQIETLKFLQQALDEDRYSEWKLFP